MFVNLRPRSQLALEFVHVADDAYDPRSLALLLTNLDLVANGIPSREKASRELYVNNRDQSALSQCQNRKSRVPSLMESA